MKKLLLVAMVMVGSVAMGQTTISTSDDEYNYLTKGYELSIENGLPIKDGYKLEKINDIEINGFNFSFNSFKTNDGTTKAILVIMTKLKSGKNKMLYRCLPINRPDLQKEVAKSFEIGKFYTNTIGSSMLDNYNQAINVLIADGFSKFLNK